ncbi:hypothetical protein CTI12_AA416140 [Artemisia annua]|uniref:Uncharacterized protein n=1 Tax=Artemisia annua TaxID=35608 RepID=A0A2U1M666_ARTAN|nr:hypothetical protein CTI12_AA416140 [Artemisia annua]
MMPPKCLVRHMCPFGKGMERKRERNVSETFLRRIPSRFLDLNMPYPTRFWMSTTFQAVSNGFNDFFYSHHLLSIIKEMAEGNLLPKLLQDREFVSRR